MAAYTSALKLAADSETAVRLHRVLLEAKRGADADRLAAGWLRGRPRDTLFLSHLGQVALQQDDFAQAEARYREVLKFSPDDVMANNNVAWAMARQNKTGAIAFAEKANKLRPDQPEIIDTLAFVLAEESRYDDAIRLQRKAVEIQPQTATFRLNLAKIYIKAGKKDLAEAELDELEKLGDKFDGQPEVARLAKSLKGG